MGSFHPWLGHLGKSRPVWPGGQRSTAVLILPAPVPWSCPGAGDHGGPPPPITPLNPLTENHHDLRVPG